ncbi:MAG: hypothetical protein K2I81_00505 [Alphaproteobacteria bacterium]|nr:hypothetical protein [Alphaproteobacteria bacterium]
MKRQDTVFDLSIRAHHPLMRTAMAAVIVALSASANAAGVVSRGSSTSTSRPTVSRANNAASRMPTITTNAINAANAPQPSAETPQEPEPAPEPEPEPEEQIIIENKADQFSAGMATATAGARDTNADNLADMIRRQRAALDAQAAGDAVADTVAASLASGQNACDIGLRNCMKEKCGSDYSKCAGDGDTIWGDKMDACRRNVTCTGHQYALFSAEIKADRDMNAKLSAYNKIIDCGNEYNDCIVTECGVTYSKCLGKTAGDAAISKCGTIAKNCTQQDSGLASRTMNVFATLRQDAEKQIVKDEQRLYEMRDKMRSQCQRLGAMFDERSLVCVYTVNFFAGNSTTPMASKKAYAGSAFDCTQDWFGIDVTTFKENAYRYTRSQTSASSALMGSGLGIGVGAVTSGAIDRAIDRQKAEKAAKEAEKQHEADYGDKQNQTSDKADKADNSKDKKSEKTNGAENTADDNTPAATTEGDNSPSKDSGDASNASDNGDSGAAGGAGDNGDSGNAGSAGDSVEK